MSNQDQDGFDAEDGAGRGEVGPAAVSAADTGREEIISRRRARQSGRQAGGAGRILGLAAIMAAGTGVFVILYSPSLLTGLFSSDGLWKPNTSKVDLEVSKDNDPAVNLEFPSLLVPPDEKAGELDAELAALKKKLAEMEAKANQPAPSDAQRLLDEYNRKLEIRLKDERESMSKQVKQYQDEANRLREEAQRREQEEMQKKLQEASKAKEEEIAKLQRESKQLVFDTKEDAAAPEEPAGGTAPGGSAGTGANSSTANNQKFLAMNAKGGFETSFSKPLFNPSKTIIQGTVISGVLETAINTELPGNIRALVTEPVFSHDGTRILMPAGTTLIGSFNPEIDVEQKRVLIAWNRAVTPEGQSVMLAGTGADSLGRGGTAGHVNNRYFKKFGAAVLISAISIAPDLIASALEKPKDTSTSPNVNLNVGGSDSGAEAVSEVGSSLSGKAADVFGRYLSLPPIIQVPQGEEIRIFVNRDLVFK